MTRQLKDADCLSSSARRLQSLWGRGRDLADQRESCDLDERRNPPYKLLMKEATVSAPVLLTAPCWQSTAQQSNFKWSWSWLLSPPSGMVWAGLAPPLHLHLRGWSDKIPLRDPFKKWKVNASACGARTLTHLSLLEANDHMTTGSSWTPAARTLPLTTQTPSHLCSVISENSPENQSEDNQLHKGSSSSSSPWHTSH